MIDGPVVQIKAYAPSREVLRDRSGRRLGTIERLPISEWRVARTPSGKIVGIHQPWPRNVTRNASGYILGEGDLLAGLLWLERLKEEAAR